MRIQFSERKEKYCFPKFPIAPFAKEAEPNRTRGWRNVPLAKGRERYTSPGDLFWGGFIFQGMLKCSGKGTIPTKKCSACSGHGVFQKGEEITVNIPPGIRDGEAISMPGLGEAVAGGVAGDLYVKFTVGKHPVFRRENLNLIMDLDVKMSEALLGVEKDIMTLDGLIKLKVPAGINSGEILAARGKGVPHGHGLSGVRGRGDPDDKSRH